MIMNLGINLLVKQKKVVEILKLGHLHKPKFLPLLILSPNCLQIWPEVFIIPEHRLSFKLKEGTAKGSLCWISKSELLSVLSEEIQQYTLIFTMFNFMITSFVLFLFIYF